jgi:hypothetical protein
VTDATTNVGLAGQEVSIAGAQQTISIMIQTADAVALTGATIAAAASAAAALNPLDAVAAALLGAKFTVEIGTLTTFVAADALQLINDAASIALASQTLTFATGQLTQATQSLLSWQAGFAAVLTEPFSDAADLLDASTKFKRSAFTCCVIRSGSPPNC